jgi:hypothetical protein
MPPEKLGPVFQKIVADTGKISLVVVVDQLPVTVVSIAHSRVVPVGLQGITTLGTLAIIHTTLDWR